MKQHLTPIVDLLIHEYAVSPAAIVDGPRGFVGETYIVDSMDGRRFFAKLLPASSHLAAMTGGLFVLEELHALGIANVNYPRRTRAGQLAVELQGRTMMLFDFIDGRPGSAVGYDFEQYVALLARIHQATPRVRSEIPHEDFGLPFADEWQQRFEHVTHQAPLTEVQADLQQLMQPYHEQITHDWTELLSLARACQQSDWTPVITHGDAVGDNVLVGNDHTLYLVDWDELMLGPAERDTWFWLQDHTSATDFLRVYRQTFPDYHREPLRYRFYLWRRFFEDLTGYLVEIGDNPLVEHQRKNLAELHKTCFQWLWPVMRQAG